MLALFGWFSTRPAPGPDGPESAANTSRLKKRGLSSGDDGSPEGKPRWDESPRASVSGSVRDEQGAAIARAQVCVKPLANALKGRGSTRPVCAETDAQGKYRVDGILPVRSTVVASASEHIPSGWSVKVDGQRRDWLPLQSGEHREGIDLTLPGGGVLVQGVVRDLTGGEVEGALVSFRSDFMAGDRRSESFANSDAEGVYKAWVAPGPVWIFAEAEGYAASRLRGVAPGNDNQIFLTPESVLRGRVVHAETGAPVADAWVRAESNELRMLGPGHQFDARTEDDGTYRIGGLMPGDYAATASTDELYGVSAPKTLLGLAETSDDVEIRAYPTASVSGRIVVDEAGTGCDEGSVTIVEESLGQRHTGATDDFGELVVMGIRPGTYSLTAACRGYLRTDPIALEVGETPIAEQRWQVKRGLSVRGVVVDAQDRPVAGVTVSARETTVSKDPRASVSSGGSTATEADGIFEIPALVAVTYELSCYGQVVPPAEPTEVDLTGGTDKDGVRIKLRAGGRIEGRVVDEKGNPQPKVHISASSVEAMRNSTQTTTADDGSFTLENLATGGVRISMGIGGSFFGVSLRPLAAGPEDPDWELVQVEEGKTTRVELRVAARSGKITGKVVDSEGQPIADAFVSASRLSESAATGRNEGIYRARWDGEEQQPHLSDQDGEFTVEGLEPGTYVVFANRRGGGEGYVEGVAAGSRVEVRINETGEMSGTLVGADGSTPSEFTITAMSKGAGRQYSESFFRSEGRWSIPNMREGTYTLVASSLQGSARLEDVGLGAGERKSGVELTLEPRVTLKGRVVDLETGEGIPGIQVAVMGPGGGRFFASQSVGERKEISDADGYFEVADVAVGKGQLFALAKTPEVRKSYSYQTRLVDIAKDPTVQTVKDIRMPKTRVAPGESEGDLGYALKGQDGDEEEGAKREFSVAVVRPGGPAASAGLHVGDVIVSVDGHSVVGDDEGLYLSLARVKAGTSITLGVTRDGKPLTLTLVAGQPR